MADRMPIASGFTLPLTATTAQQQRAINKDIRSLDGRAFIAVLMVLMVIVIIIQTSLLTTDEMTNDEIIWRFKLKLTHGLSSTNS
jgi:hypothetical protein